MTKAQALKKVEIAIGKMIDLYDGGRGNDNIARILERLNRLHGQIERS